jgi:hypothetical protein
MLTLSLLYHSALNQKQHHLSNTIPPHVNIISPVPFSLKSETASSLQYYIYRPMLALSLLYHTALYQKQHHLSTTIPPHVNIISPVPYSVISETSLSFLYPAALCIPETALSFLDHTALYQKQHLLSSYRQIFVLLF